MRAVRITALLLGQVVRVHREAFAGYANARLGAGYAARFIQWFTEGEDRIALAVVDDSGAVLGYVLGARGAYGYALSRAIRLTAAGAMLLRPWVLLDRRVIRAVVARVRMWIRPVPVASDAAAVLVPPIVSLVAIGTARATRRSGVAKLLMEEFENAARALGARSMRLKVYDTNVAARSLYERHGWQLLVGADASLTYWKAL